MRFDPMPTTVRFSRLFWIGYSRGRFIQLILADQYERYQLTYKGCHVFSPRNFVGYHFGVFDVFACDGEVGGFISLSLIHSAGLKSV